MVELLLRWLASLVKSRRRLGYFKWWRPHRSIGQRAPRAPPRTVQSNLGGNIIAKPVLDGLHHIYDLAA
jgi:hypothetical protein